MKNKGVQRFYVFGHLKVKTMKLKQKTLPGVELRTGGGQPVIKLRFVRSFIF